MIGPESDGAPADTSAGSISTVFTRGDSGSSSDRRSGRGGRLSSGNSNGSLGGLSKAAAGINAGKGTSERPLLGVVSPASSSSSQYAATVSASGRVSGARVIS